MQNYSQSLAVPPAAGVVTQSSRSVDADVGVDANDAADVELAHLDALYAVHPGSAACWGKRQWELLHQYVAAYPDKPTPEHEHALREYVLALMLLLPCTACGRHWSQLAPSVQTTSRRAAIKWAVDAHNAVNRRLNKPVLSYQEAAAAVRAMCAPPTAVRLASTRPLGTGMAASTSTSKALIAAAATAGGLFVVFFNFVRRDAKSVLPPASRTQADTAPIINGLSLLCPLFLLRICFRTDRLTQHDTHKQPCSRAERGPGNERRAERKHGSLQWQLATCRACTTTRP